MAKLNKTVAVVTQRIIERSKRTRNGYLSLMHAAQEDGPARMSLSCGNLAHGFAASDKEEKSQLSAGVSANIAIVTAYNDMLSAHQPFQTYPDNIKQALRDVGSVGQVAGGVPAMCDGVTQGQPGMDLSLFSRDTIAMGTAIAMSHNMFDGGVCLGVCDKIIPGLLIGALRFGHLPFVFIPAGPMRSGLKNSEKARIRQEFAKGNIGRDELLVAESASYHSPGTCTFYGTANSNQMLMEIMGLHLPGSAFPNPDTPLRSALTKRAAQRASEITALGDDYRPISHIVDERTIVNAIVGLHATGGSTNHTLHIIAIARAAGIHVNWEDFNDLAKVTPLVCRIYPNGQADVNHFHAAGGLAFVIRELLDHGLLHGDVKTIAGDGLHHYTQEPFLDNEELVWRDAPSRSGDEDVLGTVEKPFSKTGGLSLLSGKLGRAVIKVSAVKEEHRFIRAPAVVFSTQEEFLERFKTGELKKDFVAVVRFQGPRANGMPELHKLTPPLGVLQDQGYKVALITDGRMSGASGKVPAAIHLTPEALGGGPIGKIQDGDMITLDAENNILDIEVDDKEFGARAGNVPSLHDSHYGFGRELFSVFRGVAGDAEEGASSLPFEEYDGNGAV